MSVEKFGLNDRLSHFLPHVHCVPIFEMSQRKIGGQYGEIRAAIDVAKLNQYLVKHVPVIKTPVEVKQFKVCANVYVNASSLELNLFCSLARCD